MKRALPAAGLTALLITASCGCVHAQEPTQADAHKYGQLDLLLRTYAESLQILEGSRRHAIVESARLLYQSPYFGEPAGDGMGLDLGLYGAVRFDGGGGSRNMLHFLPDGTGSDDVAWGYLGEYALKAKMQGTLVKYGLQMVANPFMQPYDIRALPPTFRGLSVVSSDVPGISLQAGSFDGVIPRGDDHVRGLSTTYAGLPFDRISYAGVSGQIHDTALALFASQSSDLWNQYYGSARRTLKLENGSALIGQMDAYLTRGTGERHAGDVHDNAISASLTVQRGPHSVLLGYQVIDGDEFMDYTQETAGIYLGNAMGVDYNGPHERSLQLRYMFDGNRAGIPGWTLMAWILGSHGVDASVSAAAHADPADPLHDLYWKGDTFAQGGRSEWAAKTTYLVQDGALKDLRLAFYVYRTRIDNLYPSKSFNDMQLMVNYVKHLF